MTHAVLYLDNKSFTVISFLLSSEMCLGSQVPSNIAFEIKCDWSKAEAVFASDWFRSGHVAQFWPIRCQRRLAVGSFGKTVFLLPLGAI